MIYHVIHAQNALSLFMSYASTYSKSPMSTMLEIGPRSWMKKELINCIGYVTKVQMIC